MSHGGWVLGASHGGWLLADGLSSTVIAGLIAVRPLPLPCTAPSVLRSPRRPLPCPLPVSPARPPQVFWGTCFVLNFGATMYSLNLYINTAKYMFLGKDTKYKAGQVQGDTGAIDESDARVEDRTIIFIRHGESTWNQTFNPGARARPPPIHSVRGSH